MIETKRLERNDADRREARSPLRSVADYFHDSAGRLFDRASAVSDVAATLGVEEAQASKHVGRVVGDRVDPVVAVPTADETFLGVVDYHEGDGWYGYVDYHDLRGAHKRGVCAQCVREATTDDDVYAVTTEADRPWDELAVDLDAHFRSVHPSVVPESVAVETGAVLRSRTTVGGNRVWHAGNDGTGSGFDAASVDGTDSATLNRGHTGDIGRHLDVNRLGLKLWYRFDVGTGGRVADFSQHGATGDRKGTTWTDGRIGSALSFDGSDDRVAVNENLVYTQSGELDEFTVTCWMKTTSSSEMSLVAWDRSEYYRFGIDSSGPALKVTSEGGSTYDHTPGGSITDGDWHHVAARYDHATGTSTLFVDGSQHAQTSAFGDGTSIGTGVTRYGLVGVGSEASSPDSDRNSNYFDGVVDEIRIYHRALSGSEIQAIYDGVA